jgi:ligand-binding sensor domain-containing protein
MFLLVMSTLSFCVHAQQFWERLPGLNGTFFIQCLAEDASGGRLYAGAPNGGGMFVSTDNGVSWMLKVGGLPQNANVTSITIASEGIAYAIIGANSSVGKAYKSIDGGDSWQEITASPGGMSRVHITASGVLLTSSEIALGGQGIFRSTDGGTTWQLRATGIPSYVVGPETYYRSVSAIDSDVTGTLYAAVNGGSVTTEIGVYKSTNNGDSWTRMSAGLLQNVNVKPVIVGPNGTVFVGVRNRVYRSTDGAATWVQTDSIPMASSNTINRLVANASQQLFAATQGGSFRAENSGSGWTNLNNPIGSASDFKTLNDGSYITCGLEVWGVFGGIHRSTNNGASWIDANTGVTNALTTALTVTPGGSIFNGLGRGRIDYSHNNGASFSRVILPYTGSATQASIAALLGNSSGVVVAALSEGLFTSSDNGSSWTKTSTWANNRALALDQSGNFLAGNSNGVWKSTNDGQTWAQLPGGGNVYSLFVTSGGTILAGTFNAGINRSSDGGATWTNSGTSLFGAVTIGQFVQLPNGTIYVHTLGGLFSSTDDGASWTAMSGTPVGVQYRTLVSAANVLLLGTQNGLYKSTDEGAAWTFHNQGMLNTILDYLALAPDGRLYGAGGAGVYRTIDPIVTSVGESSDHLPMAFRLDQNYPNPFNPSTKITFSIPVGTGHAPSVLKVYDLLGREVRTLVNDNLQPGSYEVNFNAEGLASGVYFYRLVAGEFVQTRRLILLR